MKGKRALCYCQHWSIWGRRSPVKILHYWGFSKQNTNTTHAATTSVSHGHYSSCPEGHPSQPPPGLPGRACNPGTNLQSSRIAPAAAVRPGDEADGPSTVTVTILHGLTCCLSDSFHSSQHSSLNWETHSVPSFFSSLPFPSFFFLPFPIAWMLFSKSLLLAFNIIHIRQF